MTKRTMKMTNSLTGKTRVITLPGAKKPKPTQQNTPDQGKQEDGGNSGKNKR